MADPLELTGGLRTVTHFRAHARVALLCEAHLVDLEHGAEYRGRVVNLGLGGARVVIDGAPTLLLDTAVELTISPPTRWDPLLVRGKVTWLGATGELGVAFEHGSPGAVHAIYQVLSDADRR